MTKLRRADVLLVVIDVQEKLMPVISGHEQVTRNIVRLVRGCRILDVPAILTEQYVKGLGPTVAPIRRAFEESGGYRPIEKMCFSTCGCGEFEAELRSVRKKQILVAGIEAHVCVYQSVIDLMSTGHEVTIVADATSSREARNRSIALERMVAEGAKLSSTEMALFELTVASGTDEFRAISKLIK
jgi:nicotinamidase-related amidase